MNSPRIARIDPTPSGDGILSITLSPPVHDPEATGRRTPQAGPITWTTDAPDGALHTSIDYAVDGPCMTITARLEATIDCSAAAGLDIVARQGFAVALFEDGVVQRTPHRTEWVASPSALVAAYAISPVTGSTTIEPLQQTPAVAAWREREESVTLTLLALGGVLEGDGDVVDGEFDLARHIAPARIAAGDVIEIRARIVLSDTPAPVFAAESVDIPDAPNSTAHALALWGTAVPTLGSLAIRGSSYPSINVPGREYGPLHTFFDPDSYWVTASLSYSGVPYLQQQCRDVIERSLKHITADGLVPHHFDGEEPTYVAISGSPQPGPNLFLTEAAIDHAAATGDTEWLLAAWDQGLRSAMDWLLAQLDPQRGLLKVVGALWVDVFRRAGYTLDTNAMAVRTFTRAAEVADLAGDILVAGRLRAAVASIRDSLSSLWADSDDHFVTSRSDDWNSIDDHIDTENYLAIAHGITTDDQAASIMRLFNSSPLTHPGDRGTWVSLRRYDGGDCYLNNTGDSDCAMGRLWWADLFARRVLGDKSGFHRHFTPVRDDLLQTVWMRERYAAGGHPTRARGYHEYPGVTDLLIREVLYGLGLNTTSVVIDPIADGPFDIRYGGVRLHYSRAAVRLELPSTIRRTVTIRGLHPNTTYVHRGETITADGRGEVSLISDAAHVEISLASWAAN